MENKEANENLMTAVIRGDIDMAIEALQSGASIHIKTTKGNNLLYVAASRTQEDMFDWLLEVEQSDKKIDLNTQNNMGSTTIMEFIREDGFYNYIKKILEAGANPNITTNDGMSPLIQACADKKFEEVQLLLENNVDINYAIPDTKTTAFLMAATQSSMSICETLKEHGADINVVNSTGKNALIQAIFKTEQFMKKREKIEHKALCIFLADIGIDLDYVAPSGMTALWVASVNRNKELVKHLLDKGVKADVWHEIGLEGKMSALHIWANTKEVEIVKQLVQNGAKLNTPDENGNTPDAYGFANPSMRSTMLELNADVNSIYYMKKSHPGDDAKGIPSITTIISGGNKQKDIVKEMINRGAKVTFDKEFLAHEPIMMAIASSAYDIVNDLLETKKINIENLIKLNSHASSVTPLMLAVSGTMNQKFEAFLAKKQQYELIKKAKEVNDKNGVKSALIDDEGMQEIESELKDMEHIEEQLKAQRVQILDSLLNYGAKINTVNEEGNSAIFFANDKESANWLMTKGADIFIKNNDGNNPLIYAISNNKKDLISFLKEEYESKKDKTIEDVYYQLAFTPSDNYHQQELLEKGIKKYLDDEIDKDKFKEENYIFNVKNINYQDTDGNSAILVASANNLPFLVSLYFKLGADINLKNNNDETPLMHAISTGNERLVDFLIEKGADSNVKTKDGKTTLDFAIELNNKEVLEKIKISLGHEVSEGSISGIKKIKPI